jgi:hypothetical protein
LGAKLLAYIKPYQCSNILRAVHHTNNSEVNDDGSHESTKIESVKKESGLKVYPNPSLGVITIDNQEDEVIEVKLMDLSGKIVYKELINNLKLYTINLPLL